MDSCLTNDDAQVVGGSEDGRVMLWDLVEANVVTTLQAHKLAVSYQLLGYFRHYFMWSGMVH